MNVKNVKGRMIVMPLANGLDTLVPFVIAVNHITGKHVACWLEYHEGDFDPSKCAQSTQPPATQNNVIERFQRLPTLKVRIDGVNRRTFRAVCDRSMGGNVGVIECDGGTLWTRLPP